MPYILSIRRVVITEDGV